MDDDLSSRVASVFAKEPPAPEQPPLYRDRPAPGTATTVKPDWADANYDAMSQGPAQKSAPTLNDMVAQALSGSASAKPTPDQPVAYKVGQRMAETTDPSLQQALAGSSGYTDTLTMGWAPWAEAAAVKGLSYIDPRESTKAYREKIQQMPLKDLVEMSRGMSAKAQEAYPKTALAGEAAGVIGGAAALPVIGPEASPFISGALTGATYGALGGLSENLDPMQALKEGAISAGLGGATAPLLERFASKIAGALKSGDQITSEYGYLMPQALQAAKEAGLSQDEINRLLPHLTAAFEKYGISPEAARTAQFERFGIEPTKGMATLDPAQVALETKNVAPGVGPYASPSYERIGQQAGEAAVAETGGQPLSDVRGSVGQAVGKIQSEAESAEEAYQSAYKKAGEVGGQFDRNAIQNIGSNILDKWATDDDKLAFWNSDAAQKAAQDLDNVLGSPIKTSSAAAAEKLGETLGAPIEAGGPSYRIPDTFRAAEEGRKTLRSALSNASNPTDRAAISQMINDFDDHIENAVNEGAFSGDPSVVQQWQDARSAYKNYMDRFGIKKTGGDSGSLIRSIVDGTKTPDDVSRMLYNFSNTGDASMAASAGNTIRQMERALGPNAPEIQQIKNSFLRQLMTPNGGTQKDFATTAKNITNFLEGRGGGVAREMFGQDQVNMLKDFSNIMAQSAAQRVAPTAQQMGPLRYMLKKAPRELVDNFLIPMAYAHPVAGAVMAGLKSIIDLGGAYKNAPEYLSSVANAPFTRPAEKKVMPELRKAIPLGVTEMNRQEDLDRRGRATGGKIGKLSASAKAARLIAMVDRIKKEQGNETKPLLNLDDTTVAKALAIANRGI